MQAGFPLGEFTKSRVREISEGFDLSVASKKESQDVCFIAKDYRKFIEENSNYQKPKKGFIKNLEGKIEYVEMPNLIGKTVRDAFSELKRAGIKPQISGRGLIVSQSIEAGTKIEKKSICILKAELKE